MMNDKKFSRRRRGGMRFRPSGGIAPKNRKNDRAAAHARAVAIGEGGPDAEPVFDRQRHSKEILKAENIAAGLPPNFKDGEARGAVEQPAKGAGVRPSGPPEVKKGRAYVPVPIAGPSSKGVVGSLRAAADQVITKVKRMMTPSNQLHKEVVINAESLETRVAILEDGKLEEFNIERVSDERLVGSVYKGIVRNLEDGLKAAFVDIGFDKNAFLHYWDIVPNNFDSNFEVVDRGPKKRSKPRITQRDIPRLYPVGSEIVVQVTKGPIGNKGPRVTTNLAIPGRYLVLLPNSDQSGVSRKIDQAAERARLRKIVRNLTLPDGTGVIIRTAGQGQKARYFVRDLALLLEQWHEVQRKMEETKAPACVFQEPDLVARTIRDFLTEDVERIIVDRSDTFGQITERISKISKRSAREVKLYQGSQPLFDRFGITRQLENTFSRQAHLKSGGYIVIDETEALVAIDVNTGRHKSTTKDQESTLLKVNLEAAEEICRQLRLRNIGGLIILDFIDMKSKRDQHAVYYKVKECLRRDKSKTHVLPISPLGLMEMTRQRHTESVRASVYDDCMYCRGRGKVKSALTMSVEIQRKLGEILKKRERDESDFRLMVVVNPDIFNRLRTEDEAFLIQMEKRYFGKLSFRPDPDYHPEEFKIINMTTKEELVSVGRSESGGGA